MCLLCYFSLIQTSPKNDFCRLFCKFGLLEPLTRTLIAVHLDKESYDAPAFVLKIAGILHMFSQGDKVVKLHFAKPAVIESMLRVLPSVPQEPLILLLKSIRNISMDSTTLDLLEAAGAIPALVPFLDAAAVSENQHQVLLTMYYLCQIKASRQEQAALSGIIPHLQRFIREEHPLKQFAYPIIFLLAKTSWRTRLELKKHQGLQFYINILTSADVYWRSAALDCISVWLSASNDDTARVSFLLNTPSNINKLLRVFKDTEDATQFDKMLPSFRKILASSVKVNQSLGRCQEFSMEIRARSVADTQMHTRREEGGRPAFDRREQRVAGWLLKWSVDLLLLFDMPPRVCLCVCVRMSVFAVMRRPTTSASICSRWCRCCSPRTRARRSSPPTSTSCPCCTRCSKINQQSSSVRSRKNCSRNTFRQHRRPKLRPPVTHRVTAAALQHLFWHSFL